MRNIVSMVMCLVIIMFLLLIFRFGSFDKGSAAIFVGTDEIERVGVLLPEQIPLDRGLLCINDFLDNEIGNRFPDKDKDPLELRYGKLIEQDLPFYLVNSEESIKNGILYKRETYVSGTTYEDRFLFNEINVIEGVPHIPSGSNISLLGKDYRIEYETVPLAATETDGGSISIISSNGVNNSHTGIAGSSISSLESGSMLNEALVFLVWNNKKLTRIIIVKDSRSVKLGETIDIDAGRFSFEPEDIDTDNISIQSYIGDVPLCKVMHDNVGNAVKGILVSVSGKGALFVDGREYRSVVIDGDYVYGDSGRCFDVYYGHSVSYGTEEGIYSAILFSGSETDMEHTGSRVIEYVESDCTTYINMDDCTMFSVNGCDMCPYKEFEGEGSLTTQQGSYMNCMIDKDGSVKIYINQVFGRKYYRLKV